MFLGRMEWLERSREHETKDSRGRDGTKTIRRNKGLRLGTTDHVEASSARDDKVNGTPDDDNCDGTTGRSKSKEAKMDG